VPRAGNQRTGYRRQVRCALVPNKKQRVLGLVAARGWGLIGEDEWKELRAALPDVSEATVRRSGIAIAQPWRGVAQHTIEELDRSLRELSSIYAQRPDLRRYCRDQVIAAKDRARYLSRIRPLKAEMAEWMLVWLGDPAMFPAWAGLRRKSL
jgi:hypothetical protein